MTFFGLTRFGRTILLIYVANILVNLSLWMACATAPNFGLFVFYLLGAGFVMQARFFRPRALKHFYPNVFESNPIELERWKEVA